VGKEAALEGLVPETLRPLLTKRLALKRMASELDPRDCRVAGYKARAAALKWLLVVCFGYLGYKNARFGKIESHEAVTALSRELLLQAKEVAEDLGFTVLHMYVDSLFVHKNGCARPADFAPLLDAITAQTGLAIALDGVYKWLFFPSSKRDVRVPVPNRYFGVFQGGEIKARGIALRRGDTPKFIAEAQMEILQVLARLDDAQAAQTALQRQIERLQARRVPVEDLLIASRLSRAVEEYRVPSPAARAAKQLMEAGKVVRPGMRIRFVHTYDEGGVRAWGAGDINVKQVDVKAYRLLLVRAAEEVLESQNRSQSSGAIL
jgi:DNA polymerase-2